MLRREKMLHCVDPDVAPRYTEMTQKGHAAKIAQRSLN
jgi:hypothetical protein